MVKKFYRYVYIIMLAGYIFDLSTNFSGIGSIIKYVFSFLLLTSLIGRKINLKNYYPILSISIPFFLIPLILILAEKYILNVRGVFIYSISFLLFIFLTISIIEFFPNILEFCRVTNYGVLISLLINVVISNELSLNIYQMLINMIENTRTNRAYLGFTNPNVAGLIATIGLVIIVIKFFHYSFKIADIVCFFFYMLVIINSGSRTALLSPIIGGLVLILLSIYHKIPPRLSIVIICFTGTLTLLFIYYKLTSSGIGFDYYSLNKLTSSRLERQRSTINYLIMNGYILWGVGNLNSSALYSTYLGTFLDTDNSPIYFITTIGIVGLTQVIAILAWFFSRIGWSNRTAIFCFVTMISSSLFEHTLLVSTSLFSLFFLCVIFISIKEESNINKEYSVI
ncbi:O-antigen ligase family protein [Enterococcus sp. 2201sp1_2201st1_C11_2201SCRN_220225]|uniref:O-antigen ligase family protein n=1 Tax=Enterococcus sp. 2201sp1_2201st1_C11_2201SCRN_220225 TaxID=3141593 RepID=UPI0034A2BA2A